MSVEQRVFLLTAWIILSTVRRVVRERCVRGCRQPNSVRRLDAQLAVATAASSRRTIKPGEIIAAHGGSRPRSPGCEFMRLSTSATNAEHSGQILGVSVVCVMTQTTEDRTPSVGPSLMLPVIVILRGTVGCRRCRVPSPGGVKSGVVVPRPTDGPTLGPHLTDEKPDCVVGFNVSRRRGDERRRLSASC